MMTDGERIAWRLAQAAAWLVGAAILVLLVAAPRAGIDAFWNGLIPVAPALLAFAPGVWRNVCPLGTTALMARHLGLSGRRRLPVAGQERLSLGALALLVGIVPLRHAVLDLDGPWTAAVLGLLAVGAVASGLAFEWKSGWCSGLCPVHPVERLYGTRPAVTVANAHCASCERCVTPCPDASFEVHPLSGARTPARSAAGTLLAGGFAGFVWGWFQVPDGAGLAASYLWPLGGMGATLAAFVALRAVVPPEHRGRLVRVFAAAAIACYYWYRIPMLVGFGAVPTDGRLADLTGVLPAWFPAASRAATTLLFLWWLAGRRGPRRAWTVRPAFGVVRPFEI